MTLHATFSHSLVATLCKHIIFIACMLRCVVYHLQNLRKITVRCVHFSHWHIYIYIWYSQQNDCLIAIIAYVSHLQPFAMLLCTQFWLNSMRWMDPNKCAIDWSDAHTLPRTTLRAFKSHLNGNWHIDRNFSVLILSIKWTKGIGRYVERC